MAMLEFLLAALIDPVQAALVFVVVLAYRGPLPVLVAAAAASVASETITALAGTGYMWGEMLPPRLASSLAQAAVLSWIVGFVWPGRAVPWQMRAFVRRRFVRLRER